MRRSGQEARAVAESGGVASDEHLAVLRSGVERWNAWRAEDPAVKPQLAGFDLSELPLAGADLSDADLRDADLFGVDLRSANLKMAVLHGADLASARLAGADLYKASLDGTFLTEADLAGADLAGADLSRADLRGANLVGADLKGAVLCGADVAGAEMIQANLDSSNLLELRYGSFRSMTGNFYGIRGLDSCHGNALFVRDARDQDYIATLRRSIESDASPMGRAVKRVAFWVWERIDFGRSLGIVALYAVALSLAFGVLFSFDRSLEWGLLDYDGGSGSGLSPFYFSIVTYTTLGFGDIKPASWPGELLVVCEVILGYTTLGLLLAILANRVARRA
jgi:hypothetical protein